MVKIKLARTGKKNQPSYRIVVQEARAKRDGRVIEILGSYRPTRNPRELQLDKARYRFWIERGARPTSTVLHIAQRA